MTWLLYILIGSICMSCSTTRHLEEGQSLLKENSMEIIAEKYDFNKSNLEAELEDLYNQKPNTNWLGTSREGYYMRYSKKEKLNALQRYILKGIAEKPAIFDSIVTSSTAKNIEKYLINKKGFYQAEVTYDIDYKRYLWFIKRKKTRTIQYTVQLDNRSYVRSSVFIGKDFEIIQKLIDTKDASLIKPNIPIDALTFDLEKQRIINQLQNDGYANFSNNHIEIKGDSTIYDNQIEIFIEIKNQNSDKPHQRYSIGDINIYTDYSQTLSDSSYTSTTFHNNTYWTERINHLVKPSTIDNKIFFASGEFYNRDKYYKTLRKLSELEIYRFVKIDPILDDENPGVIHYNIYLTPAQYLWSADLNGDVFYSTVNTVGRRLFGLSVGGSVENKNIFNGGITYSLSAETSVEFNLANPTGPDNLINSISYNIQNGIQIPKMNDLYGTFKNLNRFNLISDDDYQNIKENTNTQYLLGYTYQNVFDRYQISSFNASYGFTYNPNRNKRIVFQQTGLNLLLYNHEPAFQEVLDTIPLLKNSFQNNLFSGLAFQEFSHFYSSKKSRSGWSWLSIVRAEFSGLEVWAANSIYNGISGNSKAWRVSDDIDFANFMKFEIDQRIYKEFDPRNSMAFRINLGYAFEYFNDSAVPFIRQFFNGGPNGIRAWQPRELGPGGFKDIATNILFYQTGDIKFEANLEYRFDLFWIFEGALFLDGGNVWTRRFDAERLGSQFSSAFIDQIALGTGYGIRLDFTYFNIRIDFGYKLRLPYEELGSHWVNPLRAKNGAQKQGIGTINLAVNYPF